MMEMHSLVLALGVGMALGVFFSLNLWATVRKVIDEHTSWYVLFGNFIFRISIVLTGLFLVSAGRWERTAAGLAGFVVMRVIMARFLGRSASEVKGAAWRS